MTGSEHGRAIGIGIPLATGAAIGLPRPQVINLEPTAAGMYTLQSLWTQAREQLDVLTVIWANRSTPSCAASSPMSAQEPWPQGARHAEPRQSSLRLGEPRQGARRRSGAGDGRSNEFAKAFRGGCSRRSPFLIEVVI